jgi:hypothetical protein
MANALSNVYENAVLNHLFRRGTDGTARNTLTQPGTNGSAGIYVALFSGSTATVAANLEAGTLTNEITLGSYSRQLVSFGTASSGTITNDATVTFPTATANYDGEVTALAVMETSTGGNVIAYGNLTVAKTVTTGDTFQIATNNLTISLA